MVTYAAIKQYRKANIENRVAQADPHGLVTLLFEGAIERINMASGYMQRREIAEQGLYISQAISIVGELRASLNFEVGGDLATRLDALYAYMTQRLLHANMKSDDTALKEVVSLLGTLKQGWDAIAPAANDRAQPRLQEAVTA